MPSGHASHKGASAKPNVNADGVIGEAADPTLHPEEVVGNVSDSTRTDEAIENSAATQRPEDVSEEK